MLNQQYGQGQFLVDALNKFDECFNLTVIEAGSGFVKQ